MAAAGKDERRALVAQRGGDRPDALALQVDVEDGEIELALLDFASSAALTLSQLPLTSWPSEWMKSSSIIAISGSSSTIRMERGPVMSDGDSSRYGGGKNLFVGQRLAHRLGQFLDREGLGQEGDIGDVDRLPAAAPRHSRT